MEVGANEKPLQIWQVPFENRLPLRESLDVEAYLDGKFPVGAYVKVWDRVAPAADPENVFFNFNRGTGGELDDIEYGGEKIQMHSLSMGDMIILDGHAFRCASFGWDDVTDEWVQAGILLATAS